MDVESELAEPANVCDSFQCVCAGKNTHPEICVESSYQMLPLSGEASLPNEIGSNSLDAVLQSILASGSLQAQDAGSEIQDPRSRILSLNPETWSEEPGCSILSCRCQIQDPGTRILDPRCWIQDPDQDPGAWTKDPGSRIQDPGSCSLCSGSKMPDSKLDPKSWIRTPGSRVLAPVSKSMDRASLILDVYGILHMGSCILGPLSRIQDAMNIGVNPAQSPIKCS